MPFVDFSERKPVGERTRAKILKLLSDSPVPLSIPELMRISGRSYPTVKNALKLSQAENIGGYPAKWIIGNRVVATLRKRGTTDILVPAVEDMEGLAERWNTGRNIFSERLGQVVITPESDPAKIAATLTSGASTLATVAHLLAGVADKPDWYAQLFGEAEPVELPAEEGR